MLKASVFKLERKDDLEGETWELNGQLKESRACANPALGWVESGAKQK